MRVIASLRKISGSTTYERPPCARMALWIDGTFAKVAGATAAAARVDRAIVEERPAPLRGRSPTKHLRDDGELLEPEEVRDVAVLLRRARGLHGGDGGRGRRREDRRRVDELRGVVSRGSVEDPREER